MIATIIPKRKARPETSTAAAASVRCASVMRTATNASRIATGASRPGRWTRARPESTNANAHRKPATVSARRSGRSSVLMRALRRAGAEPGGREARSAGGRGAARERPAAAQSSQPHGVSGTKARTGSCPSPCVGSARIAHQTTTAGRPSGSSAPRAGRSPPRPRRNHAPSLRHARWPPADRSLHDNHIRAGTVARPACRRRCRLSAPREGKGDFVKRTVFSSLPCARS